MPKKPFYRAFDDWWYAQLDANGKRTQKKLVKGKANEAEAYKAFYHLMADGPDLPTVTCGHSSATSRNRTHGGP